MDYQSKCGLGPIACDFDTEERLSKNNVHVFNLLIDICDIFEPITLFMKK